MSELAYMVREDWAQNGTATLRQSAVIRNWLGDLPLLFATTDPKKYRDEHSADREFVGYLVDDSSSPKVVSFADFDQLCRPGAAVGGCIVALHPYREQDCETLRELIVASSWRGSS